MLREFITGEPLRPLDMVQLRSDGKIYRASPEEGYIGHVREALKADAITPVWEGPPPAPGRKLMPILGRWPQGTAFWFRRTAPDGAVFGCTSTQGWSFAAALKEEVEERLGFGDVLEVRAFRSIEEMSEHSFALLDAARAEKRPMEVCPCCQSVIPKEIGVAYRRVGTSRQGWNDSQLGKITHTFVKEISQHHGRDSARADTEAAAGDGGSGGASGREP